MRATTALLTLAAAAGSALYAEGKGADGPLPGWMAGAWIAEQPDGKWVEEYWTPAKAGVMLGAGRSGKGDATEWWEQTRIELADGKLRFCALPRGQAGACFSATKVGNAEIAFENPANDFPTRVAYRRDGDALLAEISGPGGSNAQKWRFRRPD